MREKKERQREKGGEEEGEEESRGEGDRFGVQKIMSSYL